MHLTRILSGATLAAVVSLLPSSTVSASVIAESTTTTSSFMSTYVGQSFLTANDGTADILGTFEFLNNSGGTVGAGSLFLFGSPYTSSPFLMSVGAPGFSSQDYIANAAWNGTAYDFSNQGVVLQPNTEYYVYANTAFATFGSSANPYAGGQGYFSPSGSVTYSPNASFDLAFRVESAVPEPAGNIAGLFLAASVFCRHLRGRLKR